MKFSRKLFVTALAITGMAAATVAHAGPPVTVIFKNNGTTDATYKVITTNESYTYTFASPKPVTTVKKGLSNSYVVTNPVSPDANSADVRYQIGSKECVFHTALIIVHNYPYNTTTPTWTKKATGSGGAVCTATSPRLTMSPMSGRPISA